MFSTKDKNVGFNWLYWLLWHIPIWYRASNALLAESLWYISDIELFDWTLGIHH